MDLIDRRIIASLHGGFPISERPFADAAEHIGLDEKTLIDRIKRLRASGDLTRFGPLYNADRMGGGTALAAMAVPEERFDAVAEQVNAHPEVAHNYARDHALNMWFVIATDDPDRIAEVVAKIERETGIAVYSMPKLREFFVELRLAP